MFTPKVFTGLVVAASVAALSTAGTATGLPEQIRALDSSLLQEALAPDAPAPSNLVYDVVITESLARYDNVFPFKIYIETPYTRAYSAGVEARRRFLTPPTLSVRALNAVGLKVLVEPRDFQRNELIESVVLKRGDTIVRPSRTRVTPYTMENSLGLKKVTARGEFWFPLEGFSPSPGPLTIVCIERDKNHEWTLDPEDLARMR